MYFRQSETLAQPSLSGYLGRFSSTKLVPERMQTAELEIGRFIGQTIAITGNLSYNNVKAPIVYVIDSASSQTYYNAPYYTTVGTEIEIRYRSKKGYITGAATNYQFVKHHDIQEYTLISTSQKQGSRGLPQQKMVVVKT
jgi:helix-turn-helix protein